MQGLLRPIPPSPFHSSPPLSLSLSRLFESIGALRGNIRFLRSRSRIESFALFLLLSRGEGETSFPGLGEKGMEGIFQAGFEKGAYLQSFEIDDRVFNLYVNWLRLTELPERSFSAVRIRESSNWN